MNRIAIDFSPLPSTPFSFLFFFFSSRFFFYESISCYALKTTRRGEDEQEERKNRVSDGDRREQDAFRTHLIVKMMGDIHNRMLFLFIIISLTIGQQQRRSSVTIGNYILT